LPLPARYAVLTHDLGKATSPPDALPRHIAHERRSMRIARQLSERLRVPQDCRDAAELAARFHGVVHRAAELRPATVLDLLLSTDALRRPERLDHLLAACAADACSRPGASQDYASASLLRGALAAIKSVDAGAIARTASARKEGSRPEEAIASAIRAARLRALREYRKTSEHP
jgi:tRNA nucleotidyltransferase (CCA-adding enzyme)